MSPSPEPSPPSRPVANAPKRVQRQRTKGWRKPEGAVYVGRGSRWGNPWKVGDPGPWRGHDPMTPREAVTAFAYGLDVSALADLTGRDLMCWCPLDQPCHADVLLAFANPPDHQCDGERDWCWTCEYREIVAHRRSPLTAPERER